MSEFDVYKRPILTSKDGPRAEKNVKNYNGPRPITNSFGIHGLHKKISALYGLSHDI